MTGVTGCALVGRGQVLGLLKLDPDAYSCGSDVDRRLGVRVLQDLNAGEDPAER
jgi:hypothetical protein